MKKRTERKIEQPAPFTPAVTKAMVRQHAYEMFRDKLPGHPLTLDDWVMAEKDGTFEISGALPGKYSLFATSSDQKRFSEKTEVLVPHVGGPKDIELRLVEGGRVKFIVGTSEGKPVTGVKVFHLGDDGKREELFHKFTGARRDTFASWLLAPGKEKFVVEAPGWKAVEKLVEVKAGETEKVEIELYADDVARK